MALYEPIRDSFRELNRMVTDAQTWDERHAQRESDKQYKHAVLQSNLQQREFDNSMKEKQFQLSEMGETRAAKALDQQILNQNRNYEISKAEADRSEDLHEGKLKKQKADAEAQVDSNRILSEQADRAIYDAETVPVTLNEIVTDADTKNNVEYLDAVNQTANAMGFEIGPDGNAYDADGAPVELKRYEQNRLQMAAVAAAEMHYDADKARGLKRQELFAQGVALEDQLKDLPANNQLNQAERAAIKRQQNTILGEAYKLRQEAIADNSAEGLAAKADRLMRAATVMADDPLQQGMVNSLTERARALRLQAEGQVKATNKKGEVDTTELSRLDRVYDWGIKQIEKDYSPSDALLPKFPDQAAAQTYVKSVWSSLADRLGRPESNKDAAELKERVYEYHKEAHRKQYTLVHGAKTEAARVYAEEQSMALLGYVANRPYASQIYRLANTAKK